MATLTDKTYLIGKLSIPHLSVSEGVDASLSNASTVDRAFTIYEPEFLKKLLGDAYADYIDNKTSPEWVAFENKVKDDTLKISPIANYVFFKVYPDIIETNTGVGTTHAKHENSYDVTDTRLVNVWNDMVSQLMADDGVLDYLSTTIFTGDYTYPDWSDIATSINIFGI